MDDEQEEPLLSEKKKKTTYDFSGMDLLSLFIAISSLLAMGLYGMWHYRDTSSRVLKEEIGLFMAVVCVICLSLVYQMTVYCLYLICRNHQQLIKGLVMICSFWLNTDEHDVKRIEPRLFKALHTRRILVIMILDVIGVIVSFFTVFPDLYLIFFIYLFWEVATLTLERCCLNVGTIGDEKLTLLQEFRSEEYGKLL